MKKLFLIPARGGSKGLPRKNILPLNGRPIINYTLEAARVASEEGDEICVSTDDKEIIKIVREFGIEVPFQRPSELASDLAGTDEVIQHALGWYAKCGKCFDILIVLQPTSPLRNAQHILEALKLYTVDLDMVVSVKETDANPYYVLKEEDENGFLVSSKKGNFVRRQDCPKVYEFNGAIYIIKVKSIIDNKVSALSRVKKYVMRKRESIDIDDEIDYKFVKTII